MRAFVGELRLFFQQIFPIVFAQFAPVAFFRKLFKEEEWVFPGFANRLQKLQFQFPQSHRHVKNGKSYFAEKGDFELKKADFRLYFPKVDLTDSAYN